jgi:hypothetical protein
VIADAWLQRARLVVAPLAPRAGVPVDVLRAHFAERRCAVIDEIFPAAAAEALASAAHEIRPQRCAPHPNALSRGAPSYLFYDKPIRWHRWCARGCAPVCAFSRSVFDGDLLALTRGICAAPRLEARSIRVRAYAKGSHVDRSVVDRAAVEVSFCASHWDLELGGQLHFGEAEPVAPRFGALYLRELRAGDVTWVTLVRSHAPLVFVSATFDEAER